MVFCQIEASVKKKIVQVIMPAIILYSVNLVFMGTFSSAVSRYHYRAFFLLTVTNHILLWQIVFYLKSKYKKVTDITPQAG
jgi:hypothetical protein